MEKLELKDLAPYLPYGLRIMSKNDYYDEIGLFKSLWYASKRSYVTCGLAFKSKNYVIKHNINSIKPILRPLSDLTKKDYQYLNEKLIPHNANFGVGKKGNFVAHGCVGLSLSSTYKVFQYYFKNHFDVFGLIEKGLAIDRNKI